LAVVPDHVFVDESKTRGLLMVAAVVSSNAVVAQRQAMRALLLPGQRRLHFTKESPARRRKILGILTEFDLEVRLYESESATSSSRERCLGAIVRDAADSGERLAIERDESTYDFDRRTLTEACRVHGCRETLYWDLLPPQHDPMLWVPDAVAWCWSKGGDWRQHVQNLCRQSGL
jgi:hypothetical protein